MGFLGRPTLQRLVFHIDVNSAFLSWEAARRVANGLPDIRLIPSAIGGDQDKRTGIILAKSIPAKKFGVTTGEPVAMALRKCPRLQLFKPDFALYRKNSLAFLEICRRYSPVVEQFSIDECFVDMTGMGRIFPDPIATAHQIKETVKNELGFTVNIGVGPNKLLAKMASDFEKPDRVHTLFTDEISTKMWPLPVGDLLYVGSATAQKLAAQGIDTIGTLARYELPTLQRLFGDKCGKQLFNYSKGIDDSPVLAVEPEAKGYSVSTTLEEDVTTRERAHEILAVLADSVAYRMRIEGAQASQVAITIRNSQDMKYSSHQRRLPEPTDISRELYQEACNLFDDFWRGQALRLLGVSLGHIAREAPTQSALFKDESLQKEQKLDKALDALRQKFGHDAISRGSDFQTSLKVGKKHFAEE